LRKSQYYKPAGRQAGHLSKGNKQNPREKKRQCETPLVARSVRHPASVASS